MSMEGIWLRLCGGALLCVIALVVLRGVGRDISLTLQWTGIILLAGAGIMMLQPVLSFLVELARSHGVGELTSLLIRALGVAFLTQICADLCRQSGEASIAAGVELAGRAELLLMALPQLKNLLSAAQALLSAPV